MFNSLEEALENKEFESNLLELKLYECYKQLKVDDRIIFTQLLKEENINILENTSGWFGPGLIEDNNISSIEIPEGIKLLDEYTFQRYPNLSEVKLPSSLLFIGKSAFYNCEKLKNIHIPESVAYIGSSCFGECKALESIKLPTNLGRIESNLFESCQNLKFVDMPHKNIDMIKGNAFAYCDSLTNVKIPDTIKDIGDYAFYGNVDLEEIVIPKSVETVGYKAFGKCYPTKIICEVEEKPSKWNRDWAYGTSDIQWGIK